MNHLADWLMHVYTCLAEQLHPVMLALTEPITALQTWAVLICSRCLSNQCSGSFMLVCQSRVSVFFFVKEVCISCHELLERVLCTLHGVHFYAIE